MFTCLRYKSFENTVRKGEIARNVFSTHLENLNQIGNCRLQILSVWKRVQFVIWGRVNFGRESFKDKQRNTNYDLTE